MDKKLFLILVSFAFVLIASAGNVYVAKSGNSTKYHFSNNCRSLKKCKDGFKSITEIQAKSDGLTPCKICANGSHVNQPISVSGSKNSGKANNSVTPFISSFYGMPVEAAIDLEKTEMASVPAALQEQLIQHVGYTVSYNEQWLISNWVAWELTPSKANGTGTRPQRGFEPDPMVRGKSSDHYDYSNSGYSRGHMAPAADMKWSEQAMNESFYLTNICPQSAALNTSMWNRVEEKSRALARQGATLYICCGPIVEGSYKTIGKNKVAVPSSYFKVILKKKGDTWSGIGFIFPNSECKGGMFDYAKSIDEVEKITGIDFFYNLPDNIENQVEASWLQKDWQ